MERKAAKDMARAQRLQEQENSVSKLPDTMPNISIDEVAPQRKSIAQMRQTFRTFSLMRITKVLLDGTLVPEPVHARQGSADDDENARLGTATTTGRVQFVKLKY